MGDFSSSMKKNEPTIKKCILKSILSFFGVDLEHYSEKKEKWYFRRTLALSARINNFIVVISTISVCYFNSEAAKTIGDLSGLLTTYIIGNFALQGVYTGAATYEETKKKEGEESK